MCWGERQQNRKKRLVTWLWSVECQNSEWRREYGAFQSEMLGTRRLELWGTKQRKGSLTGAYLQLIMESVLYPLTAVPLSEF